MLPCHHETSDRQRRNRMISEAHHLARAFATADPSLRSVRLFGSLARPDDDTPPADIDLAVETANYTLLLGLAEHSAYPVDLVELGGLRDGIR
jgi:predicted nucleotidyltransferase